jgi:hypothetical protein
MGALAHTPTANAPRTSSSAPYLSTISFFLSPARAGNHRFFAVKHPARPYKIAIKNPMYYGKR